MEIVDGGYLCWKYGLFPVSAWEQVRPNYRGAILCIDSTTSWRASIYPTYKEHRQTKRLDPKIAAKKAQVVDFRGFLLEDPTISTCYLEGIEADDLVAIHFLQASHVTDQDLRVYAVDKDLMQVPGLWRFMYDLDNNRSHTELNYRRAPGYWPGFRDEKDVLLAQLLFGDRSDSIPRLLPRYDRDTARWIWRQSKPLWVCWLQWKEEFVRSLYQLLIPAVCLHRQYPTYRTSPEALILDLESGGYWHPDSFPHICTIDRIRDW